MSVQPVPLALVHHANQYLITDGYENREGLSELLDGYASLLAMHERMAVPCNLHISGTLLEAILWHRPQFLDAIRRLRDKGLLCLIGGAYGQNIMPLFSPEHNRRQLRELLWLYEEHLRQDPEGVTICWISERVWDTKTLAEVLVDPTLPNGGYRGVLLDDRLLFPLGSTYRGSPRSRFDARGPSGIVPWAYTRRGTASSPPFRSEAACAYEIAGGHGLAALPIVAGLRYAVPPSRQEHWRYLEQLVTAASRDGMRTTVLIYADDLERAAGLGPWDRRGLAQYEALLRWLVQQRAVEPVLLSSWLQAGRAALPSRRVDRGTFFELARLWGAGEDYRRWWSRADWRPFRRHFERAEAALRAADNDGADALLLELGWKHLLACSYETGWHDVAEGGPAPWSKALASHACAALVIAEAARWPKQRGQQCVVETRDLDSDGEEELLLKSDRLFAVVSPANGGRVVYLFEFTESGGRLIIGNPADDWNWQQELNRYMDRPPNHPGALADVGLEHDAFVVASRRADGQAALVELRNARARLRAGVRTKRIALPAGEGCLAVCYQLAQQPEQFSVDFCLSPDYLALLRYGRKGVRRLAGAGWRGWRHGAYSVWVALDPGQNSWWDVSDQPEPGHGLRLRVSTKARHVHLVAGAGKPSRARIQRSLDVLHSDR